MRYICTSIVATLLLAGTSFAATINVPADYTTIQAAVNAASHGDEIVVAPGVYTGTGHKVVNMLGKAITLRASGTPQETIIDGQGGTLVNVIVCENDEPRTTIIRGFTITGGTGAYGGGISCYGSDPTIMDCVITGNTSGGGIGCKSYSRPRITDCTISNNHGGGIWGDQSSPTISGCTITGNIAYLGGGGGIQLYSKYTTGSGGDHPTTISNCTISDNTAYESSGGGIWCDFSNALITDCIISDNVSSGDWALDGGGGVYLSGESSTAPTLSGCTISGNSTTNRGGGGILIQSDYTDFIPIINNCVISDNSATDGGGLFCSIASAEINGCVISNNIGDERGGGMYIAGGYSYDSPSITDCQIEGNSSADGGGIYAWGALDNGGWNYSISGCSISSNYASNQGGGIFNYNCGSTIDNTVVAGNLPDQIYGTWTDNGGVVVSDVLVRLVPQQYPTIQEAVNAATDDEVVLVAPGTYTGTDDWVINPDGKAITIRAIGSAEETILDGEGVRRVVRCSSGEGPDTVIEGFSITEGHPSGYSGGGILCIGSSPTIRGCIITNNIASVYYGGGIYCADSSNPVITDCTISNNHGNHGGGVYCYINSNPTLTNCVIATNASNGHGGGVYCRQNSNPTLIGCTISGNTSSAGVGGGLFTESSSPTLADTIVCDNAPDQTYGAWTDGGGNFICGIGACCVNTSCTVTTEADCSGDWLGDGTDCNGDPCYMPPTGACCVNASCTVTTEADCSGYWDGDEYEDCDGVTCYVPPTGACCVNASCTVTTEADCSGDWLGDGTDCNGDPCYVPPTDVRYVPSEYATIQAAINDSVDGDTILVDPGTYTSASGAVINLIGKAITIQATGTQEETVLDGEGARQVVQCTSNEGPKTTIQGFTITGGSSTYGGGLRCSESSPTVTGCAISNNTGTYGGAINCWLSHPTLNNCIISNNHATIRGGGALFSSSNPTLNQCVISNNFAGTEGGGIQSGSGNPMLIETVLCANSPENINGAWTDGGGNVFAEDCDEPDPCEGDFNNDGEIAIDDVLFLIGAWGGADGDLNGDGTTTIDDLLIVIGSWGPCP